MTTLDVLTITGFILTSSVLTRQIVQEIKTKTTLLKNSLYTLAASILVNTLLATGLAWFKGYHIDIATMAIFLQVAGTTYYHEYKSGQVINAPADPVNIPVSAQDDGALPNAVPVLEMKDAPTK